MDATIVDQDLPHDLAQSLIAAGRVAVDTETSGLDWVHDQLHLCQLYTAHTGPVLLRNVQERPIELARVLGDPNVTKVFHFAPFDLRFLESRWQIACQSVACTKTASRIAYPDMPSTDHSLKPLAHRHLGVDISKGDVRVSDWGVPQLSTEQISYAATDVKYLLELLEILEAQLNRLGQLQLFHQVCTYLPVDAHLAVNGIPNPLMY